MGTSTYCCLNLPPPPSSSSRPNPSSLPSSNNIGASSWSGKDRSWKTRGLIAAACLVIGMDVESFGNCEGVLAIEGDHSVHSVAGLLVAKEEEGKKWSERGMCPAWRMNSLQTVVPENLPRPAARRRWEAVGHTSRDAPAVKVVVVTSGGISTCFNM